MLYAVATTMLCSVSEFRRFAKLEDASFDYLSPSLSQQISGATYQVWQRLGGDKTAQRYHEYYDIMEPMQDYIVPNHVPVTRVVAMTLCSIGSSNEAVDSGDIWCDDARIGIADRFGLSVRYEGPVFFETGRLRVEVDYEAGYSSQRMLPLKLAVMFEVMSWIDGEKHKGWCARAEQFLKDW